MELLLEILLQLVLEVFGEILLELSLGALKRLCGRENRGPLVATAGYLLLGAIAGAGSIWLFPQRFLRAGSIPGISLLIAPLAGGIVMELWGEYRRRRGQATTNLATFYGGAALLFAYSLVRVVWAR